MPLSAGDALGPYEILALIGEGGMGEVYRGRDPRLDRVIAIKVSKDHFTDRFEREARAVAALNHPHICQIYDVGPNYLVMEHVEGSPLQGPMPVVKAVEYAAQILDALDAAHRKRITHRDLKPANILVTRQGIKLLDFGLATQTSMLEDPDATVVAGLSRKGEIAGTLQYMAPEQLQGKTVDARSDIFAFGCVLYEMLSGKRAFEGQSAASVIAAVLEREPPRLDLAPPLARVIATCLAKDPDLRFQSAPDLKRNLNWAIESGAAGQQPLAASPRQRGWLPWVLAGILAAVAAGIAVVHLREAPPKGNVPARFSFSGGQLSPLEYVRSVAISPDGKHIAFVADAKLWIRDMDSEEARGVEGSERAQGPFWSPDSSSIGFATDAEIKTVALAGGKPRAVCKVTQYRGAAWKPDGSAIFYSDYAKGQYEVPAAGGQPKLVTVSQGGENAFSANYYAPSFLPLDGNVILVAKGSRSRQQIVVIDLATGVQQVLRDGAFPNYSPSGHLVFQTGASDTGLWAVPFDLSKRRLTGDAIPLLPEGGHPSLSAEGTLAYRDLNAGRQLVIRDRSGKVETRPGKPQFNITQPRFSPDGLRIAASSADHGVQNIWTYEVSGGVSSKLTFQGPDSSPIWSPSGKEIAFSSSLGKRGIFVRNANGVGDVKTAAVQGGVTLSSWSPDGRFLLFTRIEAQTDTDLWFVERKPDGSFSEPAVFLRTPHSEHLGRISPDGRFVAYQSNETGRFEVYVRPFPGGEGKWQVSSNGGHGPAWSRGGSEIVFAGESDTLMAAGFLKQGGLSEPPKLLFRNSILAGTLFVSPFDVSADGNRFVFAEQVEDSNAKPAAIHVVVNWQEALRKR